MTHYLSQYARFQKKIEIDTAARQHVDLHWNAMNKTDRTVLEMIRCYSVKYLAAHLKHQTIETKLNVSNSTVRRTLRKLEKLQIIERIHYVRPVMSGLGANIYVILPINDQGNLDRGIEADGPNTAAVSKPVLENEPSFYKSQNIKDPIKTSHPEGEKLSTSLFAKMKNILALTGDDSKTREFFGIYRGLAGRMLKFEIHKDKGELFEDLAYRAMRISVLAMKKKTIRNLPGYFNGVLRELIDEALFSDIYQEYTVSVDGLGELLEPSGCLF
ncbi:hypothetical protein HMPREF9372_1203 [Sporosarcina newyorkensis 2681]|uniref:HTH deoR-type domain-containing protein n=1 Tax=Sporosarcina newyorkensis 2681 TaxID=1027292 RepID=F9DQX3_9BACL|nr:DeoR family transcriptional regulator [Sporosarcina newyorkensis]EGQ26812.1 hypothetical protein HMPREF9372_1203 [Sporosarcina newyorkensis 2681]